jgi:tartrate-resistant acid phosphatase type 5
MPDYNYTLNVQINDGADDLVGILMIDTVLLCGNSGYDFEYLQPMFSTIHEKRFSSIYLRSIEDQLQKIASTSVPYILVAGHFPVWSISSHGPTKCLVDQLRPLLHKYKVSAYLCGHDHNLQRISDTYLDATVEYIVSGASNFNDNSTEHISDVPADSLKFFWGLGNFELAHGGLVVMNANVDNMTVTFFETDGKELHQNVIYPRKV